jgi:hypothetical protein
MATPPFVIDEAAPADSDIVSQHPTDERDFRDVVESWNDFEHGAASGRHKIPKGTVAARDAITDWEAGSQWINTDTTPDTLQMNTGTKATPVWVTTSGATAFGLSLIDDAAASNARTTLGLGAAATAGLLDEDDLVSDSDTDAATQQSIKAYVDAITHPVLRGHIDGLTLSNDGTDPAKDIGITAGEAVDGGQAAIMVLSSALIKKLDAAWAVGTNAGALDGTESVGGTPDADTWYHIWLIQRSDTGVVDILASESATAPTMPTNYDRKRRIGAVLFDATPDILSFRQIGDRFLWPAPVSDYTDTTPGTSAVTVPLTAPLGVVVMALIRDELLNNADAFYLYTSLASADIVPSASAFTLKSNTPEGNQFARGSMTVETDTSSQIRFRSSDGTFSGTHDLRTEGWIDPRGRNA